MKQKDVKKPLRGPEGFEDYYGQLFGPRWQSIKQAFENENQAVKYQIPGAEKEYYLDSASVLAALCLPVKGAKKLLDLCAAPGGKTLVLASRMDSDATLSANERSPERKHRLATVVQTCLPEEISSRIKVSCSDGAAWCTRQSECFDRILLDAPCSSERHVYLDSKYLNEWSLNRIKTVTTQQWALLSCAYRLLEPQGIMVYSTCALSPDENDEMIERLQKKFNKNQDGFTILEPSADISEIKDFTNINLPDWEKTKYGYQILPDKQNGAGPIFFTIICKQKCI